jgi:hypothetical protein
MRQIRAGSGDKKKGIGVLQTSTPISTPAK